MSEDLDRLSARWHYPTSVRFGVGCIAELARACRGLGMSRPLLVTDPGLARLPMVGDAVAANESAGVPTAVFSDVKGNPVKRNVDDGLAVLRDGGHDGVIAFGGGSALDAGKTIALMAGQKGSLWDYADVDGKWKRIDTGAMAPVVAVPTTSGTGSEVGRAAVIIDEATHTKRILYHPGMMPGTVIADPALVAGLPPHLTAATGMDAFAHCLEAYSAPQYHPMADGIALEGMRLVKEWLPVAVRDGANLAARAHMMAAATMGATAFQKGLGAIHALSHPVGAVYDTHHGLTNAVFMPYVLAFNRDAIAGRMERLARYLNLPDPSFSGVMDWVLALRAELDIPHTARELGVEEDRLDELSEMAARDPTGVDNPVPVGAPELKRIYEAAFEGRVG